MRMVWKSSSAEGIARRDPRLRIKPGLVLGLDMPAELGETAADTQARTLRVARDVKVWLAELGKECSEGLSLCRGEDLVFSMLRS